MSGITPAIIQDRKEGHPTAYLRVRVTAGARIAGLTGWHEGTLRLKVREPAEKGRANVAVTRLLADKLDVPPSRVRLARGGSSRDKLFEVDDLSEDELLRRLGAPML
jgi:uncharacterized protein YggU (UPF0235/DUF167 family)